MTERDRIVDRMTRSELALYASLGGPLTDLQRARLGSREPERVEWHRPAKIAVPAITARPAAPPPAAQAGPRGRFRGGGLAVECVENPMLRFGTMRLAADFLRVTVKAVWKAVTYGGTCRGRHWRPVTRSADAA